MGNSKNIFSCERKLIDLNSKDLFSIETFFNENMLKLSDCEWDEQRQIIRNAPMIALDSISRNGSMYQGKMVIESLESPYIAELIQRGTFFSELEHPDPDCSRERFMKVDKSNVCGRFINWKHVSSENMLRGDYQFVQPKGYVPLDWFSKGINFGWSLRMLTPNYEERKDANGNPYIYKHSSARMVAVDTVSIGGFKEASIVKNVDAYDASKESYKERGLEGIHLSWSQDRKKEEFRRLLTSQETLPIMEDLYGFSMKDVEDISYSKEGLITIVVDSSKGYKKTLNMSTNVYKINQVLMSGL